MAYAGFSWLNDYEVECEFEYAWQQFVGYKVWIRRFYNLSAIR